MHVPAAPSSAYRASGRPHAVRFYGMTLFLSPSEYDRLRADEHGAEYPDATEEQIARHDAWFEQGRDAAEAELADWRRVRDMLGGRYRGDVTDG